ncbi:MAG TPA: sensor domain-containing diguanylate cyclase [Gaiellaceae bacterium]|nr:sensor domain-containing diguanylate cyclase [Gaiellaceae bacterium]
MVQADIVRDAVALAAVFVSGPLAAAVQSHRRARMREHLLRQVAVDLVAVRERDEIYAVAVDAAHELAVGRRKGRVAVVYGSLTETWVVAARGDGADEVLGQRYEVAGLVEGGVLAADMVVVPELIDEVGELIVFPLIVHGAPRGVLTVRVSHRLRQRVRDSLRALAAQVALALESVALTENLFAQQSEARFRTLVQNSLDVIAILEPSGSIRYVTPSIERSLGVSPEQMLDRPVDGLFDERSRAAFMSLFRRLSDRGEGQAELELRVKGRNDDWRTFDAVLSNLIADPSIEGFVLTAHDVTERKALERLLTHQAFHDSLTGLANRALFVDRVGYALDRRKRTGALVAVLFVDLDDFKTINDSLGHAAGDDLLVSVGERLREGTRPTDTPARLGGDEFAVLIDDVHTTEDIVTIAERVLDATGKPLRLQHGRVQVRASVGIAIASDETSVTELLRKADIAMYAAKSAGKGRYAIYEPDYEPRAAWSAV